MFGNIILINQIIQEKIALPRMTHWIVQWNKILSPAETYGHTPQNI